MKNEITLEDLTRQALQIHRLHEEITLLRERAEKAEAERAVAETRARDLVECLENAIDTAVWYEAKIKIVSCAILGLDGIINSRPAPARHHHILNLHGGLADGLQGFLTNEGRFVNRKGAWKIAEEAGQIVKRCGGDGDRLFSENLW